MKTVVIDRTTGKVIDHPNDDLRIVLNREGGINYEICYASDQSPVNEGEAVVNVHVDGAISDAVGSMSTFAIRTADIRQVSSLLTNAADIITKQRFHLTVGSVERPEMWALTQNDDGVLPSFELALYSQHDDHTSFVVSYDGFKTSAVVFTMSTNTSVQWVIVDVNDIAVMGAGLAIAADHIDQHA